MKKTAVYDIDVMTADIYAWIKALAISPVNILVLVMVRSFRYCLLGMNSLGVQHSIIRGKSLAREF